MSKNHTHTRSIDVSGCEVEVEFTFTVSPIIPATGPSHSSGGEPASGGEVEIVSASAIIETGFGTTKQVRGMPVPDWMVNILNGDEDLLESLFDAARDDIYADEPDPDAAYEAMRDERNAA